MEILTDFLKLFNSPYGTELNINYIILLFLFRPVGMAQVSIKSRQPPSLAHPWLALFGMW